MTHPGSTSRQPHARNLDKSKPKGQCAHSLVDPRLATLFLLFARHNWSSKRSKAISMLSLLQGQTLWESTESSARLTARTVQSRLLPEFEHFLLFRRPTESTSCDVLASTQLMGCLADIKPACYLSLCQNMQSLDIVPNSAPTTMFQEKKIPPRSKNSALQL